MRLIRYTLSLCFLALFSAVSLWLIALFSENSRTILVEESLFMSSLFLVFLGARSWYHAIFREEESARNSAVPHMVVAAIWLVVASLTHHLQPIYALLLMAAAFPVQYWVDTQVLKVELQPWYRRLQALFSFSMAGLNLLWIPLSF